MSTAGAALTENSRRLLAAIRAGCQDDRLDALLEEREGLIRAFDAAIAGGEELAGEDAGEIMRLEREIVDLLWQRRNAMSEELAALRRGRSAMSAYRPRIAGTPVYIDREG